jgi:hypothetical protein
MGSFSRSVNNLPAATADNWSATDLWSERALREVVPLPVSKSKDETSNADDLASKWTTAQVPVNATRPLLHAYHGVCQRKRLGDRLLQRQSLTGFLCRGECLLPEVEFRSYRTHAPCFGGVAMLEPTRVA